MPAQKNEPPAIGIIGGSGLYQIEGLRDTERTQSRHAIWATLGHARWRKD